jgi:hypothetical protein
MSEEVPHLEADQWAHGYTSEETSVRVEGQGWCPGEDPQDDSGLEGKQAEYDLLHLQSKVRSS